MNGQIRQWSFDIVEGELQHPNVRFYREPTGGRIVRLLLNGAAVSQYLAYEEAYDCELNLFGRVISSGHDPIWNIGHRRFGTHLYQGSFFKTLFRLSVFPSCRFGQDDGERLSIDASGGAPYKSWGPISRFKTDLVEYAYCKVVESIQCNASGSFGSLEALRRYAEKVDDGRHDDGGEYRALKRSDDGGPFYLEGRFATELVKARSLATPPERQSFDLARSWWSAGHANAHRTLSSVYDESWPQRLVRKGERVEWEWVYVLRESDGDRIKIGRTNVPDPWNRISSHMSSSSSGRELSVVALLLSVRPLEKRLHKLFAEHLVPGKTEWFFERGTLAESIADGFRNLAKRESALAFSGGTLRQSKTEAA